MSTMIKVSRRSNPMNSLERGKRRLAQMLKDHDDTNFVFAETFDREIAQAALNSSSGNRTLNGNMVAQMQRDMELGRWYLGDGMIIFDADGSLRNGHHRLNALLPTGLSIPFLVRANVPHEEVKVMDRGQRRNDRQAMFFDGSFADEGKDFLQIASAAITQMINGGQQGIANQYSSADRMDLVRKYADGVNFIVQSARAGGYRGRLPVAISLAVFLRAYYSGVDVEKLAYAIQYISEPMAIESGSLSLVPGCASLGLLRTFLGSKAKGATGGSIAIGTYYKTGRALKAFLDNEDIKQLRIDDSTNVHKDFFPITGKIELPEDSLNQRQVQVLGSDHTRSLIEWASQAVSENNYHINDIMEFVNENRPTASLTSFKKRVSIAAKAFGSIALSDLGSLRPLESDTTIIQEYFYTKKDRSDV